MLCRNGALSLFYFVAASLISLLPELQFRLGFNIYAAYFTNIWLLHAIQYIIINVSALLIFRGFTCQVSIVPLCYVYVTYNFMLKILSFFWTGSNQSVVSWICIWNWYLNINQCPAVMAGVWHLYDSISEFSLYGVSSYSMDKSSCIVNRQFYP